MKKEENKEQEILNEEQLDNVTGGGCPFSPPATAEKPY